MPKKKKNIGGQSPQGAQAPQGSRSTFGRKDSVFMPNIKKKAKGSPYKRALKGDQDKLPAEVQAAIKKAKPLKRFCNGKSKPFKRMKKY